MNFGESLKTESRVEFCDKNSNCNRKEAILVDFKLAAVEDVKVPAGTFKECLRFDYVAEEISNGLSCVISRCSDWYAPNVGKIKTACF